MLYFAPLFYTSLYVLLPKVSGVQVSDTTGDATKYCSW